jgi:hypothetical protein
VKSVTIRIWTAVNVATVVIAAGAAADVVATVVIAAVSAVG